MIDIITSHYDNIEIAYPIKVINSNQFDTPVNFKLAKKRPRHRWYTYKEGFSPDFVSDMLHRFSRSQDDIIFDPFGGIGTTVLEASRQGYRSLSNDINPLSNFISVIKSTNYSTADLDSIKAYLKVLSPKELRTSAVPPNNTTVLRYFPPDTLDIILKLQHWIDHIEGEKTRNLYSLALLSILENLSTHRKDGNGVKRKKSYNMITGIGELIEIFSNRISLFVSDIDAVEINVEPSVRYQSSFSPYVIDEPADLVITSPPYANCFDYSKVYMVELWFGKFFQNAGDQKAFRESSIISHVHYKWAERHTEYSLPLVNEIIVPFLKEQVLWDKKIPSMILGYFSDLHKVLVELQVNLNHGAILGIVVGNSVYAGLPIATDLILAEIATKLGFKVRGIESYRRLTPSSQQLRKMRERDKKYLRESLVVLEWV
jgi:DNA modification methylase